MWPGQPNCYYHAEEGQEDFLVLSGECLLLIEGEQRQLKAWDFVHCPPWTEHVFVGTGEGPCVFLGLGARNAGEGLVYPVCELALRHGAGVSEETTTGEVAYAAVPKTTPGPHPEGLLADWLTGLRGRWGCGQFQAEAIAHAPAIHRSRRSRRFMRLAASADAPTSGDSRPPGVGV